MSTRHTAVPDWLAPALAALGTGPLEEAGLRAHVWPLFSRALARSTRVTYLANHSLCRPPDRTALDLAQGVAEWADGLNEAWGPWQAAQLRYGVLLAQLLNAPSPQAIVPKASAGQGLRAVLNALSPRTPNPGGVLQVVATEGEFDSLDFILRVYRHKARIALTLVPARADGHFACEDIAAAVQAGTDLVVVSSVMFRTAQVLEGLPGLIAHAQARGARVLVDTYHHAGALPVDLQAWNADFAVGGSYKYLRGGPGAAWLYVRPDHLDLRTLDTGWYAKADRHRGARPEPPAFAHGGAGWNESTPPAFMPYQALAGLEFTLAIGVARLRAYSLEQQARLAALLAAGGIAARGALGAQAHAHGAFLTVRHPRAADWAQAMDARGVRVDARGEFLRLCPDILNPDAELVRAARVAGEALHSLG